MNLPPNHWSRRWGKRALMILPPLLFVVYVVHSLNAIRSLMSDSSSFHMDYADNLIEDFLELEIALETARLDACLSRGLPCGDMLLLSLEPDGAPIGIAGPEETPVYLKRLTLDKTLPAFFGKKKGLSELFTERFHEPVYWFRILDGMGREVYRSSERAAPAPMGAENRASYQMTRTLPGYSLDIVYNSFGAKQLYSVAANRINFGLAFGLFLLTIFSIVFVTWTIRQKLVLAKQKSFFVSTVSHELKTPLAIMKLAAETLAAKRFRDEVHEKRFLGMLTNEINRLAQIAHKILSFNKIEMGQIRFHEQLVDLREVIAPSLEIFQTRARVDGIRLEITQPERAVPVRCDGDLIRHAFDNILDNAFKYRGDSVKVEVQVTIAGETAALAVTDHGIGIPRAELPNLKKSFYRVDDPRLQGIRGSGLGLAISAYILSKSRAELRIVSTPGQGSTFTICLPLAKKLEPAPKEEVAESLETVG